MKRIHKLVSLALQVFTVLCILLYLPGSLVYVISPRMWWPMGLISIGFFYTWLVLLLLSISWLFKKRLVAFLLLALLGAGLPVVKNAVAFNSPTKFSLQKQPGNVRIMQWNCNGLQGFLPGLTEQTKERLKAVRFITKYQPDIICIQDFSDTKAAYVYSNMSLLRDTLGYPYFIYSPHYRTVDPGAITLMGIAIFSRYPIVDSGRLLYPGRKHPETIIWANIKTGTKLLRVATTHFQSMHLSRDVTKPLERELWQDSLVILHGSKLDKLRHFQPYHVTEAEYLRTFLDTCRMPFIFTADLNSVPSSFVYKLVKGGRTDAFLENNFGLGRTYDSWQPALRIDYLFHNQAIKNKQTSLFRTTFSDHDPVLMDFNIQ